jgi:UPF0755 protein
MPHPSPQGNGKYKKLRRHLLSASVAVTVLFVGVFSLPTILSLDSNLVDAENKTIARSFPVTVFPDNKIIVEDPRVEALLYTPPSGLSASVGTIESVLVWLAVEVSKFPLYQQLAGAAGVNNLFITIYPGYRREQVAQAFGSTLRWTPKQRTEFLKEAQKLEPDLPEGAFVPGTYFIGVTAPKDVAQITHERFTRDVLARYGTSTQAQVPLKDALTIASLLEREAGDWEDMRLISGVIWNRLFKGMNLQIDATLQYAKASKTPNTTSWWETPVPNDKYIKSAYNTYRNKGLPPGPISNSSIAAVLAALNPKKTDCMFYFHDAYGRFHCSIDYKGHVALLKKHYGQGK